MLIYFKDNNPTNLQIEMIKFKEEPFDEENSYIDNTSNQSHIDDESHEPTFAFLPVKTELSVSS